jgi:hypothetical protein
MLTQIIALRPGDLVQTNETNRKFMVVESIDHSTNCATCIWFNEEQKVFERNYIFAEFLERLEG